MDDYELLAHIKTRMDELTKHGKENTPEYEELSDDYQSLSMDMVVERISDEKF